MKGLLIYDSVGAKRNRWFIDSLIRNFKSKNIDLELIILDNSDIPTVDEIDFAIVRKIDPCLNDHLEKSGIRVFNNHKTSFIANDKWETYLLCQKLGIPTMPTFHSISDPACPGFPYVLKSCDGHGGAEVFWINTPSELTDKSELLKASGKDHILQKPCTDPGKDMRIYVLGQKVICSVLRYNPNSFKSNFSLGGKVQKSVPTANQLAVVETVVSCLQSDYIGIDFISDNGSWVLNEIEDVVGARMLYEVSDIDIAAEYCTYIESQLRPD